MFRSILAALAFIALLATTVAAQLSAERDTRATAVLIQSVAAMGGVVPQDSTATGVVVTIEGSRTQTGTVRIATRSLDQTAFHLHRGETESVLYDRGTATERKGSVAKRLPLELVVTSQAVDFPLPFLAGVLADESYSLEYLGTKRLGATTAHHVRARQIVADSRLSHIAEFSRRDIWIDVASGLPLKIAWERRSSKGWDPGVEVEVFFSNYRLIGGVLYPFSITKTFNGTPWAAISIENVIFGTGLTDADFAGGR